MAYFHFRKIRSLLHIVTIVTFVQNVASADNSTCDTEVINGQVIVNCSNRNISYFPSNLDKQMSSLDISQNELRIITRNALKKYRKLQNFTFIFKVKPPALCIMEADAFLDSKLILLDLELVRLDFLHKPIFPKSLKILKLVGILLNSSMLDLTNLVNLEELYLQNNVLVDVPLLNEFAPLNTLNIKDNPVGSISPLYIARYCKLRTFVFEFKEDSLIYENYCVCMQLQDWIRFRNLLGTKPMPLNCDENSPTTNCTHGITKGMTKVYYDCLRYHKDPDTYSYSYLIEFIVMGILLFLITIFFTASIVIFLILNHEIVQPTGTSADAVDRKSPGRENELRNADNYVTEEEGS